MAGPGPARHNRRQPVRQRRGGPACIFRDGRATGWRRQSRLPPARRLRETIHGSEIHHQGLHVRPVRHRGGHANRPGGSRDPVPSREKLARQPECLRHLVAPHPLRKLDDRRAAGPRTHALSHDRRARRGACDGPRRHSLHAGRGARPGVTHRTPASISGSAAGAGQAAHALQAGRYCRTATPTCWRPPSATTTSPSTT